VLFPQLKPLCCQAITVYALCKKLERVSVLCATLVLCGVVTGTSPAHVQGGAYPQHGCEYRGVERNLPGRQSACRSHIADSCFPIKCVSFIDFSTEAQATLDYPG
jgi:hypothetical protein